jgi:hypothetical protein
MDDEARRIILARRARFVAAALASLGTAGACEAESQPEPCLSFKAEGGTTGSGGSSGTGQGGTGLVIPVPDSGTAAHGGEGEGGEGGFAGQGPLPCLPFIEPED